MSLLRHNLRSHLCIFEIVRMTVARTTVALASQPFFQGSHCSHTLTFILCPFSRRIPRKSTDHEASHT